MEIIINTSLATHRHKITTYKEILKLISDIYLRYTTQDNDFEV